MWSSNSLTERLNLDWPILLAPMGGVTTPLLAAAVSNAGGLGGIGMWGFSSDIVGSQIEEFRVQSGRSLNVNYPIWNDPGDLTSIGSDMIGVLQEIYDSRGLDLMPKPVAEPEAFDIDQLNTILNLKPQVVSFHFGLPDMEVIHSLKETGIFILCSATTVLEAKKLENCGVDGIIAQGIEGGGHRGTFSDADMSVQPSLFALLPQVVDSVKVPVIAAGGIADGRTIAAAFMLGASGVQVGTAFLGCKEANISDDYRAALTNANDTSTIVTDTITGKPARFIKNKLIEKLLISGASPLPFPAQSSLTLPLEQGESKELKSLYAGQSVALTRNLTARGLMQALVRETNHCFSSFC